MKLSEFFIGIDWMWTQHTLPTVGMLAAVYVVIAVAANRFARNAQSNVAMFGLGTFALFFVLGLLQKAHTSELFANPVLHICIAAVAGIAAEMYRRLSEI